MKAMSIIGIILSIAGILVSISNWYVFTLQALSPVSTIYPDGREEITSAFLGHHEHSITLLIVLCAIFIFFLFMSIFSLINMRKHKWINNKILRMIQGFTKQSLIFMQWIIYIKLISKDWKLPSHNTGLAKVAVQCSADTFHFVAASRCG